MYDVPDIRIDIWRRGREFDQEPNLQKKAWVVINRWHFTTQLGVLNSA